MKVIFPFMQQGKKAFKATGFRCLWLHCWCILLNFTGICADASINFSKGDSLSTSEVQFRLNIFSAARLNISKITQRSRGRNYHFFATLLHSNIAKFQSILLQVKLKTQMCATRQTFFQFLRSFLVLAPPKMAQIPKNCHF